MRFTAEWASSTGNAQDPYEFESDVSCTSMDDAKRVALERAISAGALDWCAAQEDHYSRRYGWRKVRREASDWEGNWEVMYP